MKSLQKASKFLSDYTSIVVIAIAVLTFFVPHMMGWVNFQLFTDPVSNKFTSQSIIIGWQYSIITVTSLVPSHRDRI